MLKKLINLWSNWRRVTWEFNKSSSFFSRIVQKKKKKKKNTVWQKKLHYSRSVTLEIWINDNFPYSYVKRKLFINHPGDELNTNSSVQSYLSIFKRRILSFSSKFLKNIFTLALLLYNFSPLSQIFIGHASWMFHESYLE